MLLLRARLTISSMNEVRVLMTVPKSCSYCFAIFSGCLLLGDGWRRRFLVLERLEHFLLQALDPFQVAHRPDVGEADGEDGDEDEDLSEGEQALAALDERPVDARHRVHEGDLDLEDHEDQGDQVEARVEVEPRLSDGLLAALVDHRLLAGGRVGTQEMPG